MPRVRTASSLPSRVVAARRPEAVVVRTVDALDDAFGRIGFREHVEMLSLVKGAAPRAIVAVDGPVPLPLVSWLAARGVTAISLLPLTVHQMLPEDATAEFHDPAIAKEVMPGFSVSAPWIDHEIRIIVARVKTDRRGVYSLCASTLEHLAKPLNFEGIMEQLPPHCAIVADPLHDLPLVVSDHPLLADWVGATLMNRDPYSSPHYAEWFRLGLLPRIHAISGDRSTIPGWSKPPALAQPLPCAAYGEPVSQHLLGGMTEAAAAWIDFFKAACEPFLPPDARSTAAELGTPSRKKITDRITETLTPESMAELMEALFKGLGLLVAIHPVLKADLRPITAAYCLKTADNRMQVFAQISEGAIAASRVAGGLTNVTLVFKDCRSMVELFASSKPDLLGAMLNQKVSFDGNLNYLLKLAYFLQRVVPAIRGELRGDA